MFHDNISSSLSDPIVPSAPKTSFLYRLTHCYDRSFITALAFKQLNMGSLGVNMFIVVLHMLKTKYKVSPNYL